MATTRFLVSPPLHPTIDAIRNPWVPAADGGEHPATRRQWERFVETLQAAADVDVAVAPPGPSTHGVFAAHGALVCGNLAVLSSFRFAERRRDQSAHRAALTAAGFATTYLRQTYFEGAGDAIFDPVRPVLYVGYGWRTERSAALQLADLVDCRVMPLLLADERFFHLDQALCPLRSGHVMVYLDAFSAHAQLLLRRTIDPGYLIEVGIDDARALACAGLEAGDAFILHSCSRRLRDRLHRAGYRVFETDLDAFGRAGGGARSLALRLDVPQPAMSAASA